MTELAVIKIVQNDLAPTTDLGSSYWKDVDLITLQLCFDKGFLRWSYNKLVMTPLGIRSFGGTNNE